MTRILELDFLRDNKHVATSTRAIQVAEYRVEIQIFGTLENPVPVYTVYPDTEQFFTDQHRFRFDDNFLFNGDGKLLRDTHVAILVNGEAVLSRPVSSILTNKADTVPGEHAYELLTYVYKLVSEDFTVKETLRNLIFHEREYDLHHQIAKASAPILQVEMIDREIRALNEKIQELREKKTLVENTKLSDSHALVQSLTVKMRELHDNYWKESKI